MSGVDDIINESERLEAQTSFRKQYEKAILSAQVGMIQVRFVGKWGSAFEAWIKQQPVPGIPDEWVGGPRRIVCKGFKKDKDSGKIIYLDKVSEKIMSLVNSDQADVKAYWEESRLREFFVFNVVPTVLSTQKADEWCIQNKQTKLFVTNKNSLGVNQTIFKSLAQSLKYLKAVQPESKLDSCEFVFTRSGSGYDTTYSCQIAASPDWSPKFNIAEMNTYDVDEIVQPTSDEEIYRMTGWWFNDGPPPAINVKPKVGSGNSGHSTPPQQNPSVAINPQPAVVVRPAPVVRPAMQPAQPQVVRPTQVVQPQPQIVRPTPVVQPAPQPQVVRPAPIVQPAPQPQPQQQTTDASCPSCNYVNQIYISDLGSMIACAQCGTQFETVPF